MKTIKKIFLMFIFIFSFITITACSCEVDFTISFMVEGEEYYTLQTSGETLVRMPTNPTKEGHVFKGWFWDEDIWEIPFTVNSLLDIPLSSDMCVYAKFEKIHIHDLQYFAKVEPTCTTDGIGEYWTCTTCNMLFADEAMTTEITSIPVMAATGHNIKLINGKSATCTTVGYTEGQECTVCNKVLVAQKKIDKLPHVYNREVVSIEHQAKPASCTERAEYYYTCSCGRKGLNTFTYGNVNPHTYEENKYLKTAIYHYRMCDICDYTDDKSMHIVEDTKCSVCDKEISGTENISYTLHSDTTLGQYYIVSGIGYAESNEIVIPATVNGCPVVKIDNAAFKNNTKITALWLPETITTIGNESFRGCTNLTAVYVGRNVTSIGNYAFSDCSKLEEINLSTLTSIGSYAFSNCKKIASISIDKLTALNTGVFSGCTSLTDVSVPDTITTISSGVFRGCTNISRLVLPKLDSLFGILFGATNREDQNSFIPSKLKSVVIKSGAIIPDAFYGCTNIQSIEIGDQVCDIYSGAFYNCTALKDIHLGSGIKYIADCVFYNTSYYNNSSNWENNLLIIDDYLIACRTTTIGNVIIPNNVKMIATFAFLNCANILSVTATDSLKIVSDCAFDKCTSLKSVDLGDGVISLNAFVFKGCTSLTDVTLSNKLESMDYGAFQGCTSLKTISIPSSVTYIGEDVFYGCDIDTVNITDLSKWLAIGFAGSMSNPLYTGADLYINGSKIESLNIPSSITTIKQYAFYGCGSIVDVTIPSNVVTVNYAAFKSCINLESIVFSTNSSGNTACTYMEAILSGCPKLKYVRLPFIGNRPIPNTNYTSLKYMCGGEIPATLEDIFVIGGTISSDAFVGAAGLKRVGFGENVTAIGARAFDNVTTLQEVTIPSSITTIESNAFRNTNIKKVHLSDIDKYAYINFSNQYSSPFHKGAAIYNSNTKVYAITITKAIKSYAFYGIDGSMIILGNGANVIGSYAFYNSTVTDILFEENSNCTSILDYAFAEVNNITSIVLPDGLTSIGAHVFENCTSLQTIDIGQNLTSIGVDAFNGCQNMEEVSCDLTIWLGIDFANAQANPLHCGANFNDIYTLTIPNTITEIKDFAFYGATNITFVDMSVNVTNIGEDAFYNCSLFGITLPTYGNQHGNYLSYAVGNSVEYLTILSGEIPDNAYSYYVGYQVTIGADVTSIGDRAFKYNLGSITFASNSKCTSIGSEAFMYTSIDSLTIPSSVTDIGESVCEGCSYLTYLDLSQYTGSIPYIAFANCKNLTNVIFSNSTTTICEYSFEGCTSLTSITLPKSLKGIANGAFYGCSALEYIYIPAATTWIGDYAFDGCTSLSYIDVESKTAWNSLQAKLSYDNYTNPKCYGGKTYYNGVAFTY